MGLCGQAAPSTVKFAWPRTPPPATYLALVPVRAPHAPRRWHVPASAPLFRGGLRAARPTHPVPPNSCQGVPCAGLQMRGRAGPGPRSQGSGEQGAGQGTAFGQSTEAEGLRGEQDSRVPPARPPRTSGRPGGGESGGRRPHPHQLCVRLAGPRQGLPAARSKSRAVTPESPRASWACGIVLFKRSQFIFYSKSIQNN